MSREIKAEGVDWNGDLAFRVEGTLVGFRLLRPLPNLRFLVPLPTHTHPAYRPDPNGWRVLRDEHDHNRLILAVPRRYRPVCRILYGVEIEELIVADVAEP